MADIPNTSPKYKDKFDEMLSETEYLAFEYLNRAQKYLFVRQAIMFLMTISISVIPTYLLLNNNYNIILLSASIVVLLLHTINIVMNFDSRGERYRAAANDIYTVLAELRYMQGSDKDQINAIRKLTKLRIEIEKSIFFSGATGLTRAFRFPNSNSDEL